MLIKLVQKNSHSLKVGENLKDKLLSDKEVIKRVTKKELDNIFSGKTHLVAIGKVITKTLGAKSGK